VAFTWVRGYIAETNKVSGGGYIFGAATDTWTLERLRFNIRFSGYTAPAHSYDIQPWRGQGLNFGIVEEYGGGVTTDQEYVYTNRNSTDWLWWEHVTLKMDTETIYVTTGDTIWHQDTYSGPADGVRDIKAKRKLGGTTPHMALHWGVHNAGVGPVSYTLNFGYSALYSH
jgi:hypothetical protein